MTQEDVDKGYHLNGLSQSHTMCENAAKTIAGLELLYRLHQVVIQKLDAINLRRKRTKKMNKRKSKCIKRCKTVTLKQVIQILQNV